MEQKSLETKEETILLQDDKDNLVHEAAEENLDVLKKEVLVENKDDKKANIYLLNGIHMLKDTNEERKVDAIKVIKDSAKYGSVMKKELLLHKIIQLQMNIIIWQLKTDL